MTTHQAIMDFVKDFITKSCDEEWDTDFALEQWEKQSSTVKKLTETKKSSVKDPNKPKRGRTAYMMYAMSIRPEVKEELGGASGPEVTKEIAARWRDLNDSTTKADKALVVKYTKEAATDKLRAEEEMKTYVPPSEEELVANKPKRGRKSTKPKSTKPKRGKSAYLCFCGVRRPELKEEIEDSKEVTKALSAEWADIKDDPAAFAAYKKMSEKDQERYEKEMESYVPSDDEDPTPKPKKAKTTAITVTKTKTTTTKTEKMEEKEGFKKYCNASRDDIRDENPTLKATEITKILKEEWADMDAAEKKAWFEEEQEE